jgi:signal transduction histidine kinase
MKVQVRLTLAHMLVVVFFLCSFMASWWMLGGEDLLILMRKPLEGLGHRMVDNAEKALGEGGWPQAEQGLRWAFLSSRASMALYRDGREIVLQGAPARPDQGRLQLAFGGQRVDYPRPEGGTDLYLPLRGPESPAQMAVIFVQLPGRGVEAHRGLLMSSLYKAGVVSGLLSLLVGVAASSLIGNPVRRLVAATQELAESDFLEPVQVGDQGELSDLARSFNRMSLRLNESVLSLRAAKEQAERSEASRRQFMADVSHNLRTPLAAVQGWTEALLDGLVPGAETVHLQKIHRETLFVAKTVERLMDWARWEESPPKLCMTDFPLSEPLLDSASALEEAAESKNISLEFQGLECEPTILADRHRTREIFQLLLENAVHHNPSGTIIRAEFEIKGDRVLVSISDNGRGLPEEYHRDLTCRCGGGLGLAIASRLVEAHGGQLTLDPGPETCFRFSLTHSKKVKELEA